MKRLDYLLLVAAAESVAMIAAYVHELSAWLAA